MYVTHKLLVFPPATPLVYLLTRRSSHDFLEGGGEDDDEKEETRAERACRGSRAMMP